MESLHDQKHSDKPEYTSQQDQVSNGTTRGGNPTHLHTNGLIWIYDLSITGQMRQIKQINQTGNDSNRSKVASIVS